MNRWQCEPSRSGIASKPYRGNYILIIRTTVAAGFVMAFLSLRGEAQFGSLNTKLKPETVTEFSDYASHVEADLRARWSGKGNFLQIDDDAEARQKVLKGELWVKTESRPGPVAISHGLIHDWYGAVFIPNTRVEHVLSVLEDFDRHSSIYPQVVKSHLIKRSGHDVTGYWRIEEKGQMLPAMFDMTQTAHYQEVVPGKWFGIAHADDVQAVQNSKILPAGEGMGLMWKFYSYWTLEQTGNGVLAECRSVSLSRGVPSTVAWMIRPLLNTIPRDSMDSTLRNTRKASGE